MTSKRSGPDGRRHNSPPEHGKIKPREVRNPWGRAGKPAVPAPNSMDQLLWKEASRVIGQDAEGPVDIKRRLIQKELLQALRKDDNAAAARVLNQLYKTSDRIEQEKKAELLWVFEAKAGLKKQFEFAEANGLEPPDVMPHPDHVVYDGENFQFIGPIDHKGRQDWEGLKCAIRMAACIHAIERAAYKRTGNAIVLQRLQHAETNRRRLMRLVPKGWDWREEIYCRDSMLEFTKEGIGLLEQAPYRLTRSKDG